MRGGSRAHGLHSALVIRHARPEDTPRLVELVGHFLAQSVYGTLFAFQPARIADLIAVVRRLGVIVVAEVEGLVIGMLAAVAVPSPYTGDPYVDELAWWVEPRYRHGMVGPKLLRAVEAWAAQQRPCVIKMVAPAASEVGRYYTRRGYVEVETAYVKQL